MIVSNSPGGKASVSQSKLNATYFPGPAPEFVSSGLPSVLCTKARAILYPVISYYIPLPSISQAKPFSKRRLPGIRRILLIFFLNPLAENMALCYYTNVVPVAQLDRALDSDSKGQRFESSRVRHVGTSYARSDFLLHKKSFSRSTVPPLSQKNHARLACSVINALTTARCRYQLFAGSR